MRLFAIRIKVPSVSRDPSSGHPTGQGFSRDDP
jgi:hypothetical protein